uniref:DNA polymerase I n=1 Tax=Lygus hesperus TaxID=30085 RepID=A0A0A9YWL5_LYGHE
MTHCTSMIEAFRAGGDFHSRTAMDMYPHVRKAVEAGEVLLEWDTALGAPTKPLLKDLYGSERRRAKVLNFSIAYGKTASGLAKDWGVPLKEAKATLDAWYCSRPEVLEWQRRTIVEAHATGLTRTLMGRYRPLQGINDRTSRSLRNHAERAAINTPIQGGAADIVMAGMIKIHTNSLLRQLGWRILLQIHDEIILEGPAVSADTVFPIVMHCMEHPFKRDLLVDLVVNGKVADTWYDAK